MKNGYDKITLFGQLKIGDKFKEDFSTVDEVATKIKEKTIGSCRFNGRCIGGTMIWMWSWEPVFVTEELLSAIEARRPPKLEQ